MQTNIDRLAHVLACAEANLLSLPDPLVHYEESPRVFEGMAKAFLESDSRDPIMMAKALVKGALEYNGIKAHESIVNLYYNNDNVLWLKLSKSADYYTLRIGEAESDKEE